MQSVAALAVIRANRKCDASSLLRCLISLSVRHSNEFKNSAGHFQSTPWIDGRLPLGSDIS